jgi:hypothetical protein
MSVTFVMKGVMLTNCNFGRKMTRGQVKGFQ